MNTPEYGAEISDMSDEIETLMAEVGRAEADMAAACQAAADESDWIDYLAELISRLFGGGGARW